MIGRNGWLRRWRWVIWNAILVLGGLRLAWLAVALVYGVSDIRRHHVETQAFIWAALLLIHGAWVLRPARGISHESREIPLVSVAFLTGAVALLYFPTLSIGLLSDDFVLLRWAHQSDVSPDSWDYFRPFPLAVWAGLLQVLPQQHVSVAYHGLNVALHSVNAALVLYLASRFGLSPQRSVLAALLFGVFPLSVEAVTWPAAVFDVCLSTLVLITLLVSLGAPQPTVQRVMVIVLLTLLALGTKETAVVLPVLVVLALLLGRRSRSYYWTLWLTASITILYVAVRLTLDPEATGVITALSGYQAKEMLGRPFGALSVPLHDSIVREEPLMSALTVSLPPLLLTSAALRWHLKPAAGIRTLLLSLWVLTAVAPLATMLFIGPDLQGSRYLYLSSAAWALVLADSLPDWNGNGRRVGAVLGFGLAVLFVIEARMHLRNWSDAAKIRDETIERIISDHGSCEMVVEIPATHRGVYVFMNGLGEALQLRGISGVPESAGSVRVGTCLYVPRTSSQ